MISKRKFARLIEASEVKESIGADINLDESLVVPCIRSAQERWTRDCIGPKLYEHIMERVVDGTLSGELYDFTIYYIQPALIQWTAYTILGKMATRFENIGVMEKNTENSQPSELERLKFIRTIYKNDAETLDAIIIKALKDNPESFKEWRDDCGCQWEGKKRGFSSPLYIEKKYRKL